MGEMKGRAKRKIKQGKMTSRGGYSKGTGLWIWGEWGCFQMANALKKAFTGPDPCPCPCQAEYTCGPLTATGVCAEVVSWSPVLIVIVIGQTNSQSQNECEEKRGRPGKIGPVEDLISISILIIKSCRPAKVTGIKCEVIR
jgi:hypothetical protein